MNIGKLLRKRARLEAQYKEQEKIVRGKMKIHAGEERSFIKWAGEIAVINERLRRDGFTNNGDIPREEAR